MKLIWFSNDSKRFQNKRGNEKAGALDHVGVFCKVGTRSTWVLMRTVLPPGTQAQVEARFPQLFREFIPGVEDKTELELNTWSPNSPQFYVSESPLSSRLASTPGPSTNKRQQGWLGPLSELVRLAEGQSPADVPSLDLVTHLPPWLRKGSSRA